MFDYFSLANEKQRASADKTSTQNQINEWCQPIPSHAQTFIYSTGEQNRFRIFFGNAKEPFPVNVIQENLRKIATVRAELEVLATCEVLQDPELHKQVVARLESVMAEMRPAARAQRHKVFSRTDFDLHETIVKGAQIPLLHELWHTAWDRMAAFHSATLADCWPDLRVLLAEHEFLAVAIRDGDIVGAEDAVRNHLDAIWYRVAEQQEGSRAPNDPLQRTAAHLQFFFHRQITLRSVAREVAFISPGHLSKLFRDRYGLSFQSYLQQLRLNKAADLLQNSRLRVALVARRSGYKDVSRFCVHFRRKFGMSPARWREAHLKVGR